MPIVYIHGVSIRDDSGWSQLEAMLRRFVAPKISDDPENVAITRCFWGEFGAKFRWSGACTPASPLRDIMDGLLTRAENSSARLERLSAAPREFIEKSKRAAAKLRTSTVSLDDEAEPSLRTRLKDFNREKLSDLFAGFISQNRENMNTDQTTLALLAADEVAFDNSTLKRLAQCNTLEDEFDLMGELLTEKYDALRSRFKNSIDAKAPDWRHKILSGTYESVARSAHGAGYVLTRAAAEVRMPMNRFVTMFIGDVLTYLNERGNATSPGWIPSTVLAAIGEARENQLERDNEPLIIMSHSMGGQVTYDLITHFMPNMPETKDTRIDFWCATASQVGLFEELKLFLESSEEYSAEAGNRVPYPSSHHLGYWWNVWDYNDFISYSAKSIIEGIDDEPYNTGMFMVDAHGGYLVLPSFFRRFARKLEQAKAQNWNRNRSWSKSSPHADLQHPCRVQILLLHECGGIRPQLRLW